MDDRSTLQTQDTTTHAGSGCCGGKAEAQPQATATPPVAQDDDRKPVKSGCCCSQN